MNLPQLIIIEGPDGAGKSTFIAQLVDYLSATRRVHTIAHGPYLGVPDVAPTYYRDIALALTSSVTVVVDRSWESELIYGPVARSACRITTAQRRMLERAALAANVCRVLCLPGVETSLDNYRKRKALEYLKNEDQLRAVYHAFEHGRSALPTFIYNYRAWGEARWALPDLAPNFWPNAGPGAGAWRPGRSILLVGERPNTSRIGDLKHRLPFISVYAGGGCSSWLADQLEAGGIGEEELYWINAFDMDDTSTPADFVDRLEPRAILALGVEAHEWCVRHGLEHEQYTHPQHHKRFRHRDPYPLIHRLKELLS